MFQYFTTDHKIGAVLLGQQIVNTPLAKVKRAAGKFRSVALFFASSIAVLEKSVPRTVKLCSDQRNAQYPSPHPASCIDDGFTSATNSNNVDSNPCMSCCTLPKCPDQQVALKKQASSIEAVGARS